MQTVEMLAQSIERSVELLLRYVAGFDDRSAVAQPQRLPNHLLWTLGHLALYMHRAAEKLTGKPVDLGWDPEPFAFSSEPSGDAGAYPPLAEMVARYRAAHVTLAGAVRAGGEDGLRRQVPWGAAGVMVSGLDLVLRMMFHNGTHTGQVVDTRRALGMPRVIG
jgi:DinB superfamily